MLKVQNSGPLITATNFWQTEFGKQGVYYLSTNAGVFRLLVPKGKLE